MIVVVDASAVGAMLFAEPEGATIRAHLRNETVLAPQLIDYELASVCWKRMRRYPDQQLEALTMLASLEHVEMKRVAVPPDETVKLAMKTGLSTYDAAYLWLALSRDAELVTLDQQLARVIQQLRGEAP